MNDKIKSYLSAETLIPLGFVISIMVLVVGGTTMWLTGQVNAKDIAIGKTEIKEIKTEIKEVISRSNELEKRFERVVTILEQIDRKTEILDSVQFNPMAR